MDMKQNSWSTDYEVITLVDEATLDLYYFIKQLLKDMFNILECSLQKSRWEVFSCKLSKSVEKKKKEINCILSFCIFSSR